MKRGRNGSIWKSDSGEVIALNLGADHTAEHEWGIKNMEFLLGIKGLEIPKPLKITTAEKIVEFINPKKSIPLGIDSRTQTKEVFVAHNLDTKGAKGISGYGKGKKKHTLWGFTLKSFYYNFDFNETYKNEYYSPENEDLIGYWDSSDFAVLLEDKEIAQEFVNAFSRKDIAVWVGASGPFRNGGLIIAIASRLPEDFRHEMEESDKDRVELHRAAAKTGIHRKLRKADKGYYALSPRWSDDDKTEVVFWLNPYDQRNNNFGWYSVKDLEDWIKGKGKIPKATETENP